MTLLDPIIKLLLQNLATWYDQATIRIKMNMYEFLNIAVLSNDPHTSLLSLSAMWRLSILLIVLYSYVDA